MEQYILKSTLAAEIKSRISDIEVSQKAGLIKKRDADKRILLFKSVLSLIDTLEVKEGHLEKFKSLQHISGDLHQTLEDWGYAPNLYFFDGMWLVSWISCEEGDSIKDFEGNTPEEAIDKAYNWFHSTFCNS